MMFCTDNTVLLLKLSSFSNRFLIILRAGSIGTEVNNVVNIIGCETLSWKEGNLPNLTYKVTNTFYVCGNLPTRGLNTSAMTFTTP